MKKKKIYSILFIKLVKYIHLLNVSLFRNTMAWGNFQNMIPSGEGAIFRVLHLQELKLSDTDFSLFSGLPQAALAKAPQTTWQYVHLPALSAAHFFLTTTSSKEMRQAETYHVSLGYSLLSGAWGSREYCSLTQHSCFTIVLLPWTKCAGFHLIYTLKVTPLVTWNPELFKK